MGGGRGTGLTRAKWAGLTASVVLGLTVLVPLLVPGRAEVLAEGGDREERLRIRRGYDHALKLMDAEDYAAAIPLFEAAHRALGFKNALWNMAECQVRLGQIAAAVSTFQQYRAHARTTAGERADADRRIAALRPQVARLSLAGSPDGAQVTIDGRPAGTLPLEVDLNPGTHEVEVSSPAFEPRRASIPLERGQTATRRIDLTLRPALVGVVTVPEGAEIRVGGKLVGRSPLQTQQPPGTVQVEARLPGYRTRRQTVSATPGAELRVPLELERQAARLVLTSDVAAARVWIDGMPVGNTPVTASAVRPGELEVRVEHAGFQTWKQRLRLNDADSASVEVSLRRGRFDRRPFFIAVGAAAALTVTAGALFGKALAEAARYETAYDAVVNPRGLNTVQHTERAAEASALRASATRYQYASIALFAAAGGAAAAGLGLFFYTRWRPSGAAVRITPSVGGAVVTGALP